MAPNLSFKVKSCETCVITALAISALFDNVQISISVNDKLLGGDIYIYIYFKASSAVNYYYLCFTEGL